MNFGSYLSSDPQLQNYNAEMTPYDEECLGLEGNPLESVVHYLQDGASLSNSEGSDIADDEHSAYIELWMRKSDPELISVFLPPEDERIPGLSFVDAPSEDIMNTIQSPGEVVVTPSCTTTNQIKGDDSIIAEEKRKATISDNVPCRKESKTRVKKGRTAKKRKQRRPKEEGRANRSIHLWEFLRELLNSGTSNYIQWISKADGTFRLVNSSAVAKLWGQRKNRQNMTYEKMSRALRYYYEKEILERVPNARLIYKFGSRTKQSISETGEESLSDSSDD